MKKTAFIATTTALILGFAPAAWAGSYPSHHDMKKVKYLAHELYEGADHLYDKSHSYARRGDYREREANRDLHSLAKAAHHFYRQVEDYYREPRHTERDFRRLINAYYRAKDGFHYLKAYDYYPEDFRCLTDVMDKLVYYYGGYGSYSKYDRHDRYDRRDDYRYKKEYKYKDRGYRPTKGERILYLLHHVLDD